MFVVDAFAKETENMKDTHSIPDNKEYPETVFNLPKTIPRRNRQPKAVGHSGSIIVRRGSAKIDKPMPAPKLKPKRISIKKMYAAILASDPSPIRSLPVLRPRKKPVTIDDFFFDDDDEASYEPKNATTQSPSYASTTNSHLHPLLTNTSTTTPTSYPPTIGIQKRNKHSFSENSEADSTLSTQPTNKTSRTTDDEVVQDNNYEDMESNDDMDDEIMYDLEGQEGSEEWIEGEERGTAYADEEAAEMDGEIDDGSEYVEEDLEETEVGTEIVEKKGLVSESIFTADLDGLSDLDKTMPRTFKVNRQRNIKSKPYLGPKEIPFPESMASRLAITPAELESVRIAYYDGTNQKVCIVCIYMLQLFSKCL